MVAKLNILIIGNDFRIIYLDVKNIQKIALVAEESYNGEVSEPYDFKISTDMSFLVIGNRDPNVLFVNTTLGFNNTSLISKWDNEF
jgi:hypothetical protein